MIWTKQKEQTLIDMWNRGSSRREIGDRFGVTYGSVGSKINRLLKSGDVRIKRTFENDKFSEVKQKNKDARDLGILKLREHLGLTFGEINHRLGIKGSSAAYSKIISELKKSEGL